MSESSDQGTVDNQQAPLTMEYLIHDRSMKHKALSKATDLIELLKIQLQVQKNSKEQAIQNAQYRIHCQYKTQIQKLHSRINFLQRQLKRKNEQPQRLSQSIDRSKPKLARSNSVSSFKGKNRKTQISLLKTNERDTKINQPNRISYSIEKQFLLQYLHQSRQQYDELINALSSAAQTQRQQQAIYHSKTQQSVQICFDLLKYPVRNQSKIFQETISKYKTIIQEQQRFIIKMKHYEEDLQSTLTTILNRINFLYSDSIQAVYKNSDNWIENVQVQLKRLIKVPNETAKINKLNQQNEQLKKIIEDMIKLVRQDKHMLKKNK